MGKITSKETLSGCTYLDSGKRDKIGKLYYAMLLSPFFRLNITTDLLSISRGSDNNQMVKNAFVIK